MCCKTWLVEITRTTAKSSKKEVVECVAVSPEAAENNIFRYVSCGAQTKIEVKTIGEAVDSLPKIGPKDYNGAVSGCGSGLDTMYPPKKWR